MNATTTQPYRVVATTTTGFTDPKVSTTVKWEGTDTDELSRQFPPSDVFGADPLDQHEIEGGFIITRHTFERQLVDGSWEEIDDPRRRLTPVTALERAIDEENRRLFPGDYITGDDEGYDDQGYPDAEDDQSYGPDCSDCNDYGCAACAPQNVCRECKTYFDRRDETIGEDGLCNQCHYDLAPRCADCDSNLPDGDDGLCGDCRSYWTYQETLCVLCDTNQKREGDLCKSCNDWVVEDIRRANPYFGVFWRMWYGIRKFCL